MFKLFRFSESLGESNGKKWSQIWKIMLIMGVKSQKQKKVRFFLYLFSLFQRLFNPISQSPMSKLFRILEPLGKSNGEKWSQIQKLLPIKGVKSLCKKSLLLPNFALLASFFGIGATICIGWEMLCLPYAGFLKQDIELLPKSNP